MTTPPRRGIPEGERRADEQRTLRYLITQGIDPHRVALAHAEADHRKPRRAQRWWRRAVASA